MKRIVLYLLTNLAVLIVLGLALTILGIDSNSTQVALLVAAVFGMGGSMISLAVSKRVAVWTTGARIIEQPEDRTEEWLLETVGRQARQAGIGMPEVAVYDSPDINAFATGMNRDDALVALSTGLLHHMTRDEAEAVLGHEVSHVANGDMVTLALIQGVLNTFVIFIARLVAGFVNAAMSGDEEGEGGLGFFGYMAVTIVMELFLAFLASIVVMWFSRRREFRADSGGAQLAGRHKMIAALERLRSAHEPSHLPDQMAAFGIRPKGGGFTRFFMSHPPLERRIAALKENVG